MSGCALILAGAESIVYSTIYGGIGALQAFASREDVDFFTHLEMHLRGAGGAREAKKDEGNGYVFIPSQRILDRNDP